MEADPRLLAMIRRSLETLSDQQLNMLFVATQLGYTDLRHLDLPASVLVLLTENNGKTMQVESVEMVALLWEQRFG